ncbi:sigma-54 interaction domain-containing protein [Pseudomonas aeruginosa]|uniref:sigma-54 interaction domain-containing protein n=1 Tax=Pseudomonas aeruginosa TaxID=287 RepID=UPI00053D5A96|nr:MULTISPECIES: sigma 54-interacting transcriptional regulator [Pseudomonas]ELC8336506.1 sigma 54-interacting transcriptional regulator [Pseudomonas aeruginosa]ELK4877688.1 sigma 54-interacting transcriptional regulator [Pseudomonas aeruginosa]KAA5656167.1 AAA domain-containing protein [Pseudomonas aeruginosa]KSD09767.1 AAA family ATPase [Pseudomonas aeruginosa]KSI51639.1 AAA family ATPase [Pseudomonas aeruginosa]
MAVKQRVLVCWVGGNDLKAIEGGEAGPVVSTLRSDAFHRVELLCSYPAERVEPYLAWLRQQVNVPITAHYVSLSSPVHFGEIYQAASQHLKRLSTSSNQLSILLSPGTPAMQAVWILLGKTRYPATFYQSSLEQGVQQVEVPFEIAAEYVPAANTISTDKLVQLAGLDAPVDAAFDSIVTQSERMLALKAQAQILAAKQVPVLIYGETGTGKELFARAIHNAGPRSAAPFVAVNCGAIVPELIDSTLFGHKKGAFTGAIADRHGVFQQAHGGTLFLDEFGELTSDVQVRLLRVLQEGTFIPVGSNQEQKVDVRLITATHRNLMQEVAQGRFREDLFYRIAVGVLHLPPLREREGDLLSLSEKLLAGIASQDASLDGKKISAEAKNLILQHSWRGNVRELQSTLLRAALWCQGDLIAARDIEQALFKQPQSQANVLSLDVSQGIDLQEVIADVAGHYLRQALKLTGNNKTRAASLLGLKSQQTLSNWMEKYGIE